MHFGRPPKTTGNRAVSDTHPLKPICPVVFNPGKARSCLNKQDGGPGCDDSNDKDQEPAVSLPVTKPGQ